MTPLYERSYPELCLKNVFAVDTETTLIKEQQYACNARTRISPPVTPEMVLGSVAGAGRVVVYAGDDLRSWCRLALSEPDTHLVFHNCAFDYFVLGLHDDSLRELFVRAVDEGRIHDTMILETLIQIARGSRTVSQKELVRSPKLADLAKRRCGIELNKGDIRVGFGQYLGRCDLIPKEYLQYASNDAFATYRVYQSQQVELPILTSQPTCRYPVYKDAELRFGQLSERIQISGALAFAWLEQWPLRVDLAAAKDYSTRLEAESKRLQEALLLFNLARRTPKTRKFSVRNKHLRSLLKDYCQEHELVPEYSDSGLLSLKYDWWAEVLPRLTAEQTAAPEKAVTLEERLAVWLRYCRVQRLFVRYLHPYSAAERHWPRYFNIGARTGRSSATCPPVHQVPKRRDAIRNLFICEDGYAFIEGDFKSAELVALAQVYKAMYGGSLLGDALNAGEDPHINTARRIIRDYDNLPADKQKHFRQAAKAVNFGLGGGLGALKFQKYAGKPPYNVKMTLDEAKAMRQAALAADPELQRYLSDTNTAEATLRLAAKNLGLSLDQLITELRCWQREETGKYNELLAVRRLAMFRRGALPWSIPTPPAFDPKYDLFKDMTRSLTGRLRGNASFTESKNYPFQALIADAIKLALWNVYKAWLADPYFQPTTSVHDSILVQCPPACVNEAEHMLQTCMSEAMRTVCPDIKSGIDIIHLGSTWGPATDASGSPIPTPAHAPLEIHS